MLIIARLLFNQAGGGMNPLARLKPFLYRINLNLKAIGFTITQSDY
jgi:hypothetical protein